MGSIWLYLVGIVFYTVIDKVNKRKAMIHLRSHLKSFLEGSKEGRKYRNIVLRKRWNIILSEFLKLV